MNTRAKSYPWRKHFVSDYLADPRVLLVSLLARGLLADIEGLAYCGEQLGRLTLQGRPMTTGEIARLRGCDSKEVEAALSELLAVGLRRRAT
jgi:hypothetical protein